jgi:hypothetical protein
MLNGHGPASVTPKVFQQPLADYIKDAAGGVLAFL